MVVISAMVALMLSSAFRADPSPLGALSAIGAGAVAGGAVRGLVRRAQVTAHPALARPRRLSRRARRAVAVTLLGVSLASGVAASAVFYVCPHGTMVGVFGFGLAHSSVGGPCRNGVPGLEATHLFGDWYFWQG